MDRHFETELRGIVARLAPAFRQKGEEDMAVLWDAGVTSYDNLLALAQGSGRPLDVRSLAIWTLGRLGDTRGVPPLLGLLTDAAPKVRQAAALALGELGDKRALSPLIHVLQTDTDEQARKNAAYALRWFGDSAAIDPLMRAVQNPQESVAVRSEAAESLGELGARRALPTLVAALGDPAAELRLWSAFALGVLGDARALPALERVVATDEAIVPHLMFLPSRGAVKGEAREAIERIRA